MSIVYIGTGLYQTIIYTKNWSIVAHIKISMGKIRKITLGRNLGRAVVFVWQD